MPKETLSTRDLVSDAKKDRFLEELSHHLEDSGDPTAVGNPTELAETFNGYARPKRNRKLVIMISIGLLAFAATQYHNGTHVIYDANASTFKNFVYASTDFGSTVFALPWLVILMPLYLLLHKTGVPTFLLGIPAIQTLLFVGLNTLFPVLTGLLWAGIAGFFLFPPRFLRRKLYEIFKTNLKRRT